MEKQIHWLSQPQHHNLGLQCAGTEDVQYEGPLCVRLPILTKTIDPEGTFSFEIPLPDPSSQVLYAGSVAAHAALPASRPSLCSRAGSQRSEPGRVA